MQTKNDFRKLMGNWAYLTYTEKISFCSLLIREVKKEPELLREVYEMVGKAFHPMEGIETWMEGRFEKNITHTPGRVIHDCVVVMKLDRRIRPILWPLARKVQQRVKYRAKKKAEAMEGK